MADRHAELAALLQQTAEAHHQAYIATDGADPDWPIWYASHLLDDLNAFLGASMTKSELIYLLVLLDKDQRLQAPGSEWTGYWSRLLLSRYG